jgi:stage II sporulation protein P
VLHDVTDNEYPQLGTSYTRSLKTVQKDMAENKDLKILIDLHRDAYNAGIDPSTVTINGKKVARVMIVIGTGVGQTGVGFTERPDWNKNLLLATAITNRLNQFDPLLARKVDIKTGRYNQHVSPGAILIEVGHNQNTLDEALAAVPYLAQAVAEAYSSMMESGGLVTALAPTASAGLSPGMSATPPQTYAPVTPVNMPSPSPSAPAQQVIVIEPDVTAKPEQSPRSGG